MESIKAHRDQTTRDFHNKIDTSRQRDSGLRGMIPKGDPTATAHKWRQEFNALPLPRRSTFYKRARPRTSSTIVEDGRTVGTTRYSRVLVAYYSI